MWILYMDKFSKVLLGICFIFGFLYLLKSLRSERRVRFSQHPTYFGVPGKKPPNLPVRWGYRGFPN